MTDLSVKIGIQIPSGPTIQSNRTLTVDAPQQIDLALPPEGDKKASIDIGLSLEETDKVNLLFIKSSFYSGEKEGGDLTVSINEMIKDKPLTEPLLLLGSDIIDAVGALKTITFSNTYPTTREETVEVPAEGEQTETQTKTVNITDENTAQITILVGRVAS